MGAKVGPRASRLPGEAGGRGEDRGRGVALRRQETTRAALSGREEEVSRRAQVVVAQTGARRGPEGGYAE
jgi:hypothetical protein